MTMRLVSLAENEIEFSESETVSDGVFYKSVY